MELFLFFVISFSFIALVAFGVHFSVYRKMNDPASPPPSPFSHDRKADWLLFLNPRTEPGIFIRNLKTNEKVFFPSAKKDGISKAWVVALLSTMVALGFITGFILYKIWDFVLSSWF